MFFIELQPVDPITDICILLASLFLPHHKMRDKYMKSVDSSFVRCSARQFLNIVPEIILKSSNP
jgi:hypothetical protein